MGQPPPLYVLTFCMELRSHHHDRMMCRTILLWILYNDVYFVYFDLRVLFLTCHIFASQGFLVRTASHEPLASEDGLFKQQHFFFRYRYKKPHKRTKMNETKHMKYIIESKPTISKQKLCVLIHDTCISEPTVFFGCCYVLFFEGFGGGFCIFFIIFKKEITGDLTKMTIIFFCPLGGCIYKLSNTFD